MKALALQANCRALETSRVKELVEEILRLPREEQVEPLLLIINNLLGTRLHVD